MITHVTKKLISDNRTPLMGISILWIIMHHIQFFGIYDFGLFDLVVRAGNIGVDIFLFLSSFGLYYSYSKNSSLSKFYYKRVIRILPTFVLVIILYFIIKGKPIAIFDYSTWYWAFYSNWFITFIFIMYLIFPFVYKVQKRYLYMPLILSIIFSVFLTVLLVYTNKNDIHDVPMLMAQRIPIFVAGMLYADERISLRCNYKIWVVLLVPIITLILYYKLDNILYPSYFFMTVPLMVLLTKSIKNSEKNFFSYLGVISLELYLCHMVITLELSKTAIPTILSIILVFILSLLSAILIRQFIIFSIQTLLKIKNENYTFDWRKWLYR